MCVEVDIPLAIHPSTKNGNLLVIGISCFLNGRAVIMILTFHRYHLIIVILEF